jgi:hypothetical protein
MVLHSPGCLTPPESSGIWCRIDNIKRILVEWSNKDRTETERIDYILDYEN